MHSLFQCSNLEVQVAFPIPESMFFWHMRAQKQQRGVCWAFTGSTS